MRAPGERLAGRYELVQPIRSGGMATVWRARDLRLGRPVAIKLLRPELAEDVEFLQRFEVEARHAASLTHPNVAHVYDTDVEDGQPFIVMELVDGPTVAEVIARTGRIEPSVAVDLVAAAARALGAAHRRGLIHRDVKPANLLIGRDGRVRLADFGIARALTSSRLTTPGTVLGSIPYLSPEQARGEEASASGDIFSLGVVLYEMLTGNLPWQADTPAAMATARLHPPPISAAEALDALPEGLELIVRRALQIEPTDRYPSARQFADALELWNRQHRATLGGPSKIRRATSAMVAAALSAGAVVPSLARPRERPSLRAPERAIIGAATLGGALGVARPNPSAAPPIRRGGTRRDKVRSPEAVPGATPAAPDDEGTASRRGALLLAALALVLVGIVVAGFLSGATRPEPPNGPGAGALPTFDPAGVPSPTVLPTTAATPTVQPTETSNPTDGPPRAPIPTQPPRPTPRPTEPPPRAGTPARAVAAFYEAVERHDWELATALWSPSMQDRYPPQEWLIDRFRRTTRIDITSLRTLSVNTAAGTARVAVSLTEYRTVEPSPRSFIGSWDLVLVDGRWLLDDPHF